MPVQNTLPTDELLLELLKKRDKFKYPTTKAATQESTGIDDLGPSPDSKLLKAPANTPATKQAPQNLRETLRQQAPTMEDLVGSSKDRNLGARDSEVETKQEKTLPIQMQERTPVGYKGRPEDFYGNSAQQMENTLATLDDLMSAKVNVQKPNTRSGLSDLNKNVKKIGSFLESDSGQEMLRALVYATNQPGSAGYKAAEYLQELHQADLLNRAETAASPEERNEALKHMSPGTKQLYEATKQAEAQTAKTLAETENISGLFAHQLELSKFDASAKMELAQYDNYAKQQLAQYKAQLDSGQGDQMKLLNDINNFVGDHLKRIEDNLKLEYATEIRNSDGTFSYEIKDPFEYKQTLFNLARAQLEDFQRLGYLTPEQARTNLKTYEQLYLNEFAKSSKVEEGDKDISRLPVQIGYDFITVYRPDLAQKHTYKIRNGEIENLATGVDEQQYYIKSQLTQEEYSRRIGQQK